MIFVPPLLICLVTSLPKLVYLLARMKPLVQKIIMPTSPQDNVLKYALKFQHYSPATIPARVFPNVPTALMLIITREDVSASVH